MSLPLDAAHTLGCPMPTRGGTCTCRSEGTGADLSDFQPVPRPSAQPCRCGAYSAAYSPPAVRDLILDPRLVNDAVWSGTHDEDDAA